MKKERISSSAEDYLEAVYLLKDKKEKVGNSDIASFLEITLPSVTEMLKKLRKKSLVNYKKYGKISLTPKGEKIAKEVSSRHKDLASFLKLLGVNEESAQLDACKIEHIVGKNTMNKLRKFLNFIEKAPEEPTWLKHYRQFLETGEHPDCENREE